MDATIPLVVDYAVGQGADDGHVVVLYDHVREALEGQYPVTTTNLNRFEMISAYVRTKFPNLQTVYMPPDIISQCSPQIRSLVEATAGKISPIRRETKISNGQLMLSNVVAISRLVAADAVLLQHPSYNNQPFFFR